jgi:hypothetical protein
MIFKSIDHWEDNLREKFSPEPGFETRSPALRTFINKTGPARWLF